MATLKVPAIVPSPQEDAEHLKKAFTGLGTDEGTIVKILAHRNAAQRKLIRDAYAAAYGEDLITGLEKEISGDFLHALRLWILDPAERDAKLANDSTKLLTSNNLVLMEIACTRSSSHLFKVRQTYHVMYKKSLEEDVAHHTTGDFRKLLVPLVTAFRYEGDEVNMTLAKSEAKILHDKISEKAYADDEVVRILTTRSKPQINATLNQYNDLFGNLITKELKEDPKNDFFSFLRATIKCLTYPEKYYEKTLRKSIKGLGTEENALTRVIVTQAETNLQRIKEEYHKRNDVLLEHAITSDTSGDYKKLLLAFVRGEDD